MPRVLRALVKLLFYKVLKFQRLKAPLKAHFPNVKNLLSQIPKRMSLLGERFINVSFKGEMMKNLILLIALTFVGCAGQSQREEKSKLTKVQIEESILKNKTTKSQVVELLGHPEMINSDSSGLEQWVYSKRSSESESGGVGVSTGALAFVGGALGWGDVDVDSGHSSRSTKNTTFTVYFNKQGIVERYNFRTARF